MGVGANSALGCCCRRSPKGLDSNAEQLHRQRRQRSALANPSATIRRSISPAHAPLGLHFWIPKMHVRRTLPRFLRLLALTALVGTSLVHADDYTEITQLLKTGKAAEALVKADQRLAANPRDPQLRFLRGVAQADSGKQSDAVATFTKLTEEYPELPEPYNNLAVLYANQNQLDKARTALEMAIRTNPSYATAQENLGDIYAKLASQAYNKALQLDTNNAASVKPKLALIRELFTVDPTTGKSVRANSSAVPAAPVVVAQRPPAATPAPAPTPATVPAKPPATAPAAAPAAPAAPPAVTPSVAAAAPVANPANDTASEAAAEKAVLAAVRAWAAAWAAKDMSAYLSAYDKSFDPPGNQSRPAWEKERESRIVGKSKITVQLSNIAVTVKDDKATARFRQAYSADALNVASRKTLELINRGGRWAIVRESTGG